MIISSLLFFKESFYINFILFSKGEPQQHTTKLISDSSINFHQNGTYSASNANLASAKAHGKINLNLKSVKFA